MKPFPTHLIQTGNSQGVRIPKVLLVQSGLQKDIELEVREGEIVIRSQAKHPRDGWDKQLQVAVAQQGDDSAEFEEWRAFQNDFDENEWRWE